MNSTIKELSDSTLIPNSDQKHENNLEIISHRHSAEWFCPGSFPSIHIGVGAAFYERKRGAYYPVVGSESFLETPSLRPW